MASRSEKLRRRLRWACTATTAVLMLVWIGSVFYEVGYLRQDERWIVLRDGALDIYDMSNIDGSPRLGWFSGKNFFPGLQLMPRWYWHKSRPMNVKIPLWPPLAAFALAAAGLWRREVIARSRSRAGKCESCGYSIAGLSKQAPCPECGVSQRSRSQAS